MDQQACGAKRHCPALGIGRSRRTLQLQLWAPGAPREARRPWHTVPRRFHLELGPLINFSQ
eukprot:3086496-Alexandrium_andersonii.AAC.1